MITHNLARDLIWMDAWENIHVCGRNLKFTRSDIEGVEQQVVSEFKIKFAQYGFYHGKIHLYLNNKIIGGVSQGEQSSQKYQSYTGQFWKGNVEHVYEKRERSSEKHMRQKGNVNRPGMDKSQKRMAKFKRMGLGILQCGKVLQALDTE